MSRVDGGRARPRLARSVARSRWREYRRLLELARGEGYRLVGVEEWVLGGPDDTRPELILRHDVDQHPRSALAMARVELELGVRSSWYFRWRTAHSSVVRALREAGFSIGLHYETLSRRALEQGLRDRTQIAGLLEEARATLRSEVRAFQAVHGRVRSLAPHGDSRIPHALNAELLRGQDPRRYGVEFDANEAMRGRRLAYWLTDRSGPEGCWKDGVEPADLLAARLTPILCLTHPNNWASGASLWVDRVLAALPGTASSIRTGVDDPPI